MPARDLGPWTYTANDGRTFVRRADKFITAQVDGDSNPLVGGSSAASLSPYEPMPRNYTPRAWYCSGSGGYRATVVVYDKTTWEAGLTTAVTLNVRDAGGTSHAVTSYGGREEKLGRKIGRGQ